MADRPDAECPEGKCAVLFSVSSNNQVAVINLHRSESKDRNHGAEDKSRILVSSFTLWMYMSLKY